MAGIRVGLVEATRRVAGSTAAVAGGTTANRAFSYGVEELKAGDSLMLHLLLFDLKAKLAAFSTFSSKLSGHLGVQSRALRIQTERP